jgi:hypothetical protein
MSSSPLSYPHIWCLLFLKTLFHFLIFGCSCFWPFLSFCPWISQFSESNLLEHSVDLWWQLQFNHLCWTIILCYQSWSLWKPWFSASLIFAGFCLTVFQSDATLHSWGWVWLRQGSIRDREVPVEVFESQQRVSWDTVYSSFCKTGSGPFWWVSSAPSTIGHWEVWS